jgi:hypothetical protein
MAMGGCEVADSGDFSEVAGTIGTAVQALTSNSVMPIKLNWFFIGLWLKSHLINIQRRQKYVDTLTRSRCGSCSDVYHCVVHKAA